MSGNNKADARNYEVKATVNHQIKHGDRFFKKCGTAFKSLFVSVCLQHKTTE